MNFLLRWLAFATSLLVSAGAACAQSVSSQPSIQRFIEAEQSLGEGAQKRMAAHRAYETVWTAHIDREGVLWVGTNMGLFRFQDSTWTRFTVDDGLCSNQVSAIAEDGEGGLWLGTAYGLCRFDGKEFMHVPLPWVELEGPWIEKTYPILNPNQVTCICRDRLGNLWLGTGGAGAYRYDGTTFTQVLDKHGQKMDDGLHHNWVHQIMEDAAGNIWFASMSRGGVSKFDGEEFTHFGVSDGLTWDGIRSLMQDRQGTYWFGNNGNGKGGLDSFDGKGFTNYKERKLHAHQHTGALFEAGDGKIWIGCGHDGVCTLEDGEFTPFMNAQGHAFTDILFFVEDQENNIWFGGGDGQLFRTDGKEVQNFSLPQAWAD